MVQFSRNRNPRLASFIDSDLRRLPNDWQDYVQYGPREIHCLFCGEFHDHCEVMVASPDILKPNGTMTGLFSCEDCFHFIKLKEAEVYDTVGIKASTYNPVEVENRIRLFVDEYVFATDVNMYLQQYRDNELAVTSKHEHCYFCNAPALISDEYRLIDVPMNNGYYLSGGCVRACERCWDLVKLSIPEFTLVNLRHNHRIYEEHCYCGDVFYITEAELTDQQLSGLQGKHLCPKCVLQQLQTDPMLLDIALLQPSSFVERNGNTSAGFYPWRLNRVVAVDCAYCKNADVEIDLTLASSTMKLKYQSFSGQFMCVDCAQDTRGPITVLPYSEDKDSSRYRSRLFYWQIYPLGPNIYRVVVRSASGKVYVDQQVNGWLSDFVLDYKSWFNQEMPKLVSM